ncbi:neprilysin-3-like [Dermacentor silvarum]|uniref:neprilysin-3-like n=1 Tax=Dermacentor silvarum TaxID=543639 RepID=UPI002100F5D4|nr:neprilysin-3-like [Dermacentor silvarum]
MEQVPATEGIQEKGKGTSLPAWLVLSAPLQHVRCEDEAGTEPMQQHLPRPGKTRRKWAWLARGIEITTMAYLGDLRVPYSKQNAQQKAAGMYQACLAFAKSRRTETHYLVEWMASLDLDLMNKTRLAAVNPVAMMVRSSLDLGVKAVVAVVLFDRHFEFGKRVMQIEYSKEQAEWLTEWRLSSERNNLNDYVSLLREYGFNSPDDAQLASKILGYEKELEVITKSQNSSKNVVERTPIRSLDEWEAYFSKYTNGLYKGSDSIQHERLVVKVLVKLFESKFVGENGLRYLVAWSIYRQLLTYTVPERLFGKSPVSYQHVKKYCYALVGKVMNRAMKSPYFQSQVPLEMVDRAKRMVTRLRSAFRKSLESSSWFTGRGREVALRKLDNLTSYVGSPDNRLDPVSLEKHYKPYPDALPDRVFPTWIKALSLSTQDVWLDKTTWLYDETEVTAFYNYNYNTLVVPTSLLQRPFFYPYGLLGLNYGGLGAIAAHELMHAFDVKGITLTEAYQPWNASDIIKEYTKRALCLRQMHISVVSR